MEIFVKDMELDKFLRKFPELSETVNSMRGKLPDGHRSYLVDYVVMDCVPGM
jgi:hypothetical protein